MTDPLIAERHNPDAADRDYTATARFWEYLNGDVVRITLKPGETRIWQRLEQTDEGWTREDKVWQYDKSTGLITLDMVSDARDCDGRFSSSMILNCPLHRLALGNECEYHLGQDGEPFCYPDWREVEASQRDHEAEKAGY